MLNSFSRLAACASKNWRIDRQGDQRTNRPRPSAPPPAERIACVIDAESRLVERKEFDVRPLLSRGYSFSSPQRWFSWAARACATSNCGSCGRQWRASETAVVFERFELPGQRIVAHGDGNPEASQGGRGRRFLLKPGGVTPRPCRASHQGDGLADILFVGTEPAGPQLWLRTTSGLPPSFLSHRR